MSLKMGDIVSVVCVVASDSNLDDSSISVSVNGTRAYPKSQDVTVIQHFVASGHPCRVKGEDAAYTLMQAIDGMAWVRNAETGENKVVESRLIRRPSSSKAAA